MYPHEFTNIHPFVQRVALDMVRYGYWYYVTGKIPEGKDPEVVDAKIMGKYDIGCSRWARARRKKKGLANVHYVRHQEFFAMFATKGQHEWFEQEEWACEKKRKATGGRIRDIRRQPLARGGYTISFKECSSTGRGHVAVRIHPEDYRSLKGFFLELAVRCSVGQLVNELNQFPFEPYAGIRQQRWNIVQAVNKTRKRAGLELIDPAVLRKKRRVYKLFHPVVTQQEDQVEVAA